MSDWPKRLATNWREVARMSDTKPGDGVVRVRLSHGMSDQKCWCHSDNGGTHMLVTVEEWENQAKRIEELERDNEFLKKCVGDRRRG